MSPLTLPSIARRFSYRHNVKVKGATPIGGASLSTARLGVLVANVVPLILLQFAQEQTDLFKAAVRSGPFNVLAQAEHF